MNELQTTKQARFISLRVKLLFGFTLLFGIIVGGIYYWFYRFAIDIAMHQIEADMVNTLEAAIDGIDGDEFVALATEGKSREDGLTDDPRYWRQLDWLNTIHKIEPRAWPYTYVRGNKPKEVLFIGDILVITDPNRASPFRQPYQTVGPMYQGLTELTLKMTPYEDEWGSWVSVYAPIMNSKGEKVGALGVDFMAEEVYTLQRKIITGLAISLLATYVILLAVAWVASGFFIRPILRLSAAATAVEHDRPFALADIADVTAGHDEVAHLGRVFGDMVMALRQRLADVEALVEERTAELTKANGQLRQEVAERRRAEEELRASEARYRAVVEDQTELICRFLPGGTLTFVNEAYCRYFGKESEELVGRSFMSLVPDEERGFVEKQYTSLTSDSPAATYEYPVLGPDGEIRWQQWTDRAIFDKEGHLVELQSVGRDITERRRAEEALRESEATARALLNAPVIDSLLLLDTDGRFLDLNEATAQKLGRRVDELIGLCVYDFLPPDAAELRKAKTEEAIRSGKPVRFEDEREGYWYDQVIYPVLDRQGKVVKAAIFARDITERKQAEEVLQYRVELERLITALSTHFINLAPGGIDGEITRALQTIGEFAGADRSYVCLFSDDGTKMTSTHEWCAAGIEPQIDSLKEVPVAVLPRIMEKLNRFETFYVPRAADFAPDGSAEKELLQAQDIRSFALVPMVYGGSLTGFLGFDSVRAEKSWSEETVALLRIVGEVFANALERKRIEEEIRRLNAELEQRVVERTAELQESEQKFRGIVEQSRDGIVLADEQGYLIEWNRGMEQIAGLKRAEAIGRPVWDIMFQAIPDGKRSRERYEQIKASMTQFFSTGQSPWPDQSQEVDIQRVDGTRWVIQQLPFPIKTDKGFMLCAITRDITRRKQAEDALEHKVKQLTALNRASQALAASLELDQVLGQIVSLAGKVTDSFYSGVVLVDEEGNLLGGSESEPSEVPLEQRARPEGHTNWIIQTRQAVVADDVAEDGAIIAQTPAGAPPTLSPRMVQAGVRSFADLPLIARGRLLGVLYLHSRRPYNFHGQLPLLTTFANQAAIAIENARLFEAERAAREQAENLREATAALASTLDLEQVLEAILTSLKQVVAYDSACVFLQEGEWLKVVVARGFPAPERVVGHHYPLDDILFQEIRRSGRPLILADALADPNFKRWGGTDYIRGWMGVPLMVGGEVIGFLTLDSRRAGAYRREDADLAQSFARKAAIAIHNARLFAEVRAGRERMQALSHRLVEAQEAERRYIAHELHDEVSQTLSSLLVGLCLLEREADCPAAFAARLAELKGMTKSASEDLHRLATGLHSASLDRLGLVTALRHYLQTFSQQHGLDVQFEVADLDDGPLPPHVEASLYRIAQEALANARRHAQATRVSVFLKRRGDRVILIVEDDGVGFDLEVAVQGDRLGLLGMRERAEALNGTLVVESAAGAGTTVFVEVPYVVHPSSDSR